MEHMVPGTGYLAGYIEFVLDSPLFHPGDLVLGVDHA